MIKLENFFSYFIVGMLYKIYLVHLLKNFKPRLCEENRHAFIWTKKKKKRHAYIIDKYIMLVKGQIRRKLEVFL